MKKIIKRLMGQKLWKVTRAGRETIRDYPRYAFGRGWAAPPRRMTFEITFKCNARCRMCPLYGEHKDESKLDLKTHMRAELTTDEIKSLFNEAKTAGVKHVTVTGGEPLVRNDLFELVSYAKGLCLEVCIISNGSLITERRSHEIVACGLDHLHISLDGPEELHNQIRRSPGMYSKIDRGMVSLRNAQEYLGTNTPMVTLGCTVSALNQDALEDLVASAERWKASLGFSPIFYSTPEQDEKTRKLIQFADIKPEAWHLPDRIKNVDVEVLYNSLTRAKKKGHNSCIEVESHLETLDDIRKRFYNPWHAENNKCLYPWSNLRVNPYGEVYPCSISVPMGNVREQSLSEIWNGQSYRNFRIQLRRVGLFPTCMKCCSINKYDLLCKWLPRLTSCDSIPRRK